MRNPLIASAGAALVVVSITAAACGGDSPSSPSGGGGSGGGSGGGGTGAAAATITLTPTGVSPPGGVMVAAGSRVEFVNNSGGTRNIFSDPHPSHGSCAIDNVGTLVNGQSRQTGNLNTVMTCGFHDHDFPDDARWKGSIRIQ